MKNNKGFTLTELLVTIVLIGLLLGIGIPGVMKISEGMKKRSYKTKIDLVEQAGTLWGQDNLALLQTTTCDIKEDSGTNTYNCYKTNIKELIENDYLESEDRKDIKFVNPIDDKDIQNNCVYIYKKNNRVYAYYKGTPDSGESCPSIVTSPPVTTNLKLSIEGGDYTINDKAFYCYNYDSIKNIFNNTNNDWSEIYSNIFFYLLNDSNFKISVISNNGDFYSIKEEILEKCYNENTCPLKIEYIGYVKDDSTYINNKYKFTYEGKYKIDGNDYIVDNSLEHEFKLKLDIGPLLMVNNTCILNDTVDTYYNLSSSNGNVTAEYIDDFYIKDIFAGESNSFNFDTVIGWNDSYNLYGDNYDFYLDKQRISDGYDRYNLKIHSAMPYPENIYRTSEYNINAYQNNYFSKTDLHYSDDAAKKNGIYMYDEDVFYGTKSQIESFIKSKLSSSNINNIHDLYYVMSYECDSGEAAGSCDSLTNDFCGGNPFAAYASACYGGLAVSAQRWKLAIYGWETIDNKEVHSKYDEVDIQISQCSGYDCPSPE